MPASPVQTRNIITTIKTRQRRSSLYIAIKMIDPMGLGGFGVLVQSKGLLAEESSQSLKSLRLPAM